MSERRHRVVVVGGGFGGLRVTRELGSAPCEVTLIDRRNHHLFQPLLYQVATGTLSPGEISAPLRGVVRSQGNARVMLAEATDVDPERRVVMVEAGPEREPEEVPYDTLVVATGARHAYFGNDEWEADAPGLKTVEDALEIRRRVLSAFEAAEVESDPARRDRWLTFVVVGAGPTGVELAGQIAEIAHATLRDDFHHMDPHRTRVLLVEGADRVLPTFDPRLSVKAARSLERLKVEVRLGTFVRDVQPHGVTVEHGDAREEIPAGTVLWAAGVQASALAGALGRRLGIAPDRAGRLPVGPDLSPEGARDVIVLGDTAHAEDAGGAPLPGVAPVALQQGSYAADRIRARLAGEPAPGPFRYRDKGSLATIGRAAAVAEIGRLRVSGLVAWLLWLLVHLFTLVGHQNRLLVMIRWAFSYLTHGRGARLITTAWHGDERPRP